MSPEQIKSALYLFCESKIEKKLEVINVAINNAQNAANNETKSTAGDKHDTARAMAHLETEKNAKQMAEINKLKKILPYLKQENTQLDEIVKLGSVVVTDKFNYYISANLGKFNLEGEDYLTISPISPLGKVLIESKVSQNVKFNALHFTIKEVF